MRSSVAGIALVCLGPLGLACASPPADPASAAADGAQPADADGLADAAGAADGEVAGQEPADAAPETAAEVGAQDGSGTAADATADAAADTPATETDAAANDAAVVEVDGAAAGDTTAATLDFGPDQPVGKLVAGPAGACVEVAAFAPPDCANVSCAAQTTCVTGGLCVPQAGFFADDAGVPDQAWPAVAARQDGAFAVAWSAGNYFEGGTRVKLRVFGAAGSPLSATLAVSPAPGPGLPTHYAPTVAALADGSWLLLWRSEIQQNNSAAYFLQLVSADGGALIGGPVQINATPLGLATGSSNIIQPVLTRLRNDRLLAAWVGNPQGGGGPAVWARLINVDGTPLSAELDTGAASATGPANSPAISALAGGQALLVWEAALAGKGPMAVRGRVFGEGGVPASAVLELSPGAKPYEALPAVASYPSGETLLVYKAGDSVGSTAQVEVRGRKLSASWPQPPQTAVVAGAAQTLDLDPTGTYPGAAPVAVLSNERALAVWHSPGQPPYGVWGRRHWRAADAWDCQVLDLGGPPLPGESGSRVLPAAAAWAKGRAVVVWTAHLSGGLDASRIAVRLLGL